MDEQQKGAATETFTEGRATAQEDYKASADLAARKAGENLKSAADQLRTHAPEGGLAGHVTDALASGLKQAATRLEEQGFSGMIDDVVALARRYPMQAIVVGLGCGYVVSRLRRD